MKKLTDIVVKGAKPGKSIMRFERYNRFKDLGTFNKEQALAFKKHLMSIRAARTGEALSKAITLSTIKQLQAFLEWLVMQEGRKSRIDPLDIGYFNITAKDVHITQIRKLRRHPRAVGA
jgi:hypothetical protein